MAFPPSIRPRIVVHIMNFTKFINFRKSCSFMNFTNFINYTFFLNIEKFIEIMYSIARINFTNCGEI